jgi:hypothetical protein
VAAPGCGTCTSGCCRVLAFVVATGVPLITVGVASWAVVDPLN